MPASVVTVEAGAVAVVRTPEAESEVMLAATMEVDEEEEVNLGDLVSAAGAAPVGATPIIIVEHASGTPAIQGAGGVGGNRTIKPVSEKEMIVEVKVRKGDIRGFGKLQETIPAGFTAIEQQNDEAIFTTQDRIVKFVWLNLPGREEVTVVYKLRADQRPDGEYSIDGEFGYLLNDETQKAVIGTSRFFIGPKALEAIAADDQHMGKQDLNDPTLALDRQRPAQTQPKTEVQPPVTTPPPAPRPTPPTAATRPVTPSIPGPEKGIVYKVQITAAHREVGRAYFAQRHRYTGDFSIERHEGWIKYVTGSFKDYKGARDQRVAFVQAGHNFPGPFVTAYNDGQRITVQEALIISKQQWMP